MWREVEVTDDKRHDPNRERLSQSVRPKRRCTALVVALVSVAAVGAGAIGFAVIRHQAQVKREVQRGHEFWTAVFTPGVDAARLSDRGARVLVETLARIAESSDDNGPTLEHIADAVAAVKSTGNPVLMPLCSSGVALPEILNGYAQLQESGSDEERLTILTQLTRFTRTAWALSYSTGFSLNELTRTAWELERLGVSFDDESLQSAEARLVHVGALVKVAEDLELPPPAEFLTDIIAAYKKGRHYGISMYELIGLASRESSALKARYHSLEDVVDQMGAMFSPDRARRY